MKEKNVDMIIHKIEWEDVAKELDKTERTIYNWRMKGTTSQKEAINVAIERIINNKRSQTGR